MVWAMVGAAVLTVSPMLGAAPAALATPAPAEDPICTDTQCAFLSPTGAIECVITVGDQTGIPDSASCQWSDDQRAHSAKLLPSGALEPCLNLMAAVVDRCKSEESEPATASGPDAGPELPKLGYGQTAVLGPFTCLADAEGITCTAAPSGRGFAVNTAGILPIGI